MKRIVILSLVSFFIATGSLLCYDDITPSEVYARLVQGDTLILLDVRETIEYFNGHIAEPNGFLPLTPAVMPWNSNVLENEYSRLPVDKDIIVYCQSGGRSALASAFLETNGFTRIFNMIGGFVSWTYEIRTNGFGDHSGQWVNATGVSPVVITCPGAYDTSKIIFPPSAVPVTDSIYIELHFASFKPFIPPNVPQSDMDGLFYVTALDRFGLTIFEADSLPLADTVSLIINPEFIGNIVFSTKLKAFIPGEGWRTITSIFSIPTFYRTENVLRRWYNGEGYLTTDVIAIHLQEQILDVQAYPNPFNSVTTLRFILPINSQVELAVYNIMGERVKQLVNEEKPVGTYEIIWYAEGLPSGVYFYRLQAVPTGRQAGSFVETKKMVLMK